MAFEEKDMDKRRSLPEFARDNRLVHGGIRQDLLMKNRNRPELEDERRLRREIANSNERRRMQSINAGFQSLRKIIPCHEGEKVSKAAILQQTVDYISDLEREKTRLMAQTTQLKHMLNEVSRDSDTSSQGSPPPKRKKRDTESSDEGISLGFEDQTVEDLKKELIELRCQLDRERCMRHAVEERNRNLEAHVHPQRRIFTHEIMSHPLPQVKAPPAHRHKQVYFEDQPRPEPMLVSPAVLTPAGSSRVSEVTCPPEACASSSTSLPSTSHLPSSTFPDPNSSYDSESSMSRRNLETIVEAIRHLEGEHVLEDGKSKEIKILKSDDSEKDSSSMTTSDQDDCRSDSSGRDSPVSYRHVPTITAIKVEPGVSSVHSVKYPIATQLLHRPLSDHLKRPSVIHL